MGGDQRGDGDNFKVLDIRESGQVSTKHKTSTSPVIIFVNHCYLHQIIVLYFFHSASPLEDFAVIILTKVVAALQKMVVIS